MGELKSILDEFIRNTVEKLVDTPSDIEAQITISTKAVIIQIKVSKPDCGKIIGKKGRTIDALKILCAAIKNTNFPNDTRRIIIEVLEEEESDFLFK